MKKTVAAALAAAFVVGTSATTFAAANPFSDVPAGHWAYQSVSKLAAEGVIEGYGDGTYRGDRNITRYEMAQMIAKAMAKNPTGATKAELDRLAAEFRDELDALGVRVAELEKYADKVVWHGKLEYTYTQTKTDPLHTGYKNKDTANGYIFRLEPQATVNDHWTVNARIDAYGDMKKDETTNFELVRAWAEGDYDKLNLKVGKFEFYPEGEAGLMWDTEISGGSITYGSKWKFNVTGGRVKDENVGGGIYGENETEDDPATVVGLRIDYDQGDKGLFGGAGYYYLKDDDLAWSRNNYLRRGVAESIDFDNEHGRKAYAKASIWTVNLGYKFTDLLSLSGVYAHNTKADFENKAWQAELDYGNYDDASEKGQWNVFAGYRKQGTNVSFAPTSEDALRGTRGFVVGASWAPFKNIGVIAKYFDGKYITEGLNGGHGKARHIFGRVEFFF
ncbi:MAG: S-layer homology domain-containing protein [Selenomonadaceae bacterium]|nr:S-layer homology domain-containing protein [Selenomonadaceae bacterium]